MKISVIVPIYKSERYLKRCVDSILNQTYSNLEVILVDDGSPDNCPEICESYRDDDIRVIVIHQQNAGVSAARNAGLDIASGEYVTFVDSDDYIDPNMYSSMMQIVEKYDCDIVMCDCVKEFSDHTEPFTHDIRPGFYDKSQLIEEYYPHLLIMDSMEYPATISNYLLMFRNNKNLSSIRYIKGVRYSEDWLFGTQLLKQARSFYYMKNNNYYHYFMNDQSATHKYVDNKWDDYEILYLNMIEYFEKCTDYDFSEQLNRVLLFLVYNAVGDILSTQELNNSEKIKKAKKILSKRYVKKMFSRVKIQSLQISKKLKILTYIYKYQVGIRFFIYLQRLKRRNKLCTKMKYL